MADKYTKAETETAVKTAHSKRESEAEHDRAEAERVQQAFGELDGPANAETSTGPAPER